MSKGLIKKILFYLTMAILFFPLCFQPFDGKIVEQLKGYHAPPKKVPLGIQTWFDGEITYSVEPAQHSSPHRIQRIE